MKMTHTEAMKEIKKLEDRRQTLLQNENETCTVTYTEHETPIDTKYDYAKFTSELDTIDSRIRQLKGALAKSNAITIVKGFDMSISESLVYLAQLNNHLSRFKRLADKQPLVRSSAVYRNATYEFTKTLYDVNVAKEQYQECFDLISKLQMAIDLTNLTTEIDC